MVNKRRVILLLFVVGLVLVVLGAGIYGWRWYAGREVERQPTLTSPSDANLGLSRFIEGEMALSVESGFIKSSARGRFVIQATGPAPKLTVSTQSSDKDAKLSVELKNVRAKELGTPAEGVKIKPKDDTTVHFNLFVPARSRKVVSLYPAETPTRFRFFVVGDSRDGDAVFRTIIGEANTRAPLFVFHGGDLVSTGSEREYTALTDMLKDLRIPLYAVPGNHDVLGDGRTFYRALFGPAYYSFNYGNVHFVALDTSSGGLDENQYRWLEGDLKGYQNECVIVFMHHPPFDPRAGESHAFSSTAERDLFLDLMRRYQVDRVFASHIHGYFTAERAGVPYTITGGGGAPLVSGDQYYHYVDVQVDGDRITEKVVKVTAPSAFEFWKDWDRTARLGAFSSIMFGLVMLATGFGLGRLR